MPRKEFEVKCSEIVLNSTWIGSGSVWVTREVAQVQFEPDNSHHFTIPEAYTVSLRFRYWDCVLKLPANLYILPEGAKQWRAFVIKAGDITSGSRIVTKDPPSIEYMVEVSHETKLTPQYLRYMEVRW